MVLIIALLHAVPPFMAGVLSKNFLVLGVVTCLTLVVAVNVGGSGYGWIDAVFTLIGAALAFGHAKPKRSDGLWVVLAAGVVLAAVFVSMFNSSNERDYKQPNTSWVYSTPSPANVQQRSAAPKEAPTISPQQQAELEKAITTLRLHYPEIDPAHKNYSQAIWDGVVASHRAYMKAGMKPKEAFIESMSDYTEKFEPVRVLDLATGNSRVVPHAKTKRE